MDLTPLAELRRLRFADAPRQAPCCWSARRRSRSPWIDLARRLPVLMCRSRSTLPLGHCCGDIDQRSQQAACCPTLTVAEKGMGILAIMQLSVGNSREGWGPGSRFGPSFPRIEVPDADRSRYEAILDRGAINVQARVAVYREAGWTSHDPNSVPYTPFHGRRYNAKWTKRNTSGDDGKSPISLRAKARRTMTLTVCEWLSGSAQIWRSEKSWYGLCFRSAAACRRSLGG